MVVLTTSPGTLKSPVQLPLIVPSAVEDAPKFAELSLTIAVICLTFAPVGSAVPGFANPTLK